MTIITVITSDLMTSTTVMPPDSMTIITVIHPDYGSDWYFTRFIKARSCSRTEYQWLLLPSCIWIRRRLLPSWALIWRRFRPLHCESAHKYYRHATLWQLHILTIIFTVVSVAGMHIMIHRTYSVKKTSVQVMRSRSQLSKTSRLMELVCLQLRSCK